MPPKGQKGKKDSSKPTTSSNSAAVDSSAILGTTLRQALPSTASSSPGSTLPFTLATWNVLADDHTYAHYYPQLTKPQLSWNARLPLLLRRVRQLGPDILCMQEVDQWKDWDQPLKEMGYTNAYLARGGSKQDGCSISFKTDRFMVVDRFEIRFDDLADFGFGKEERIRKHCVALGLVLRPLDAPDSTGTLNDPYNFLVVTTHLFWNPKFEDVKIQQVNFLTYRISQFWTDTSRLILCGDLNSTPDSAIATYLRTGHVDLRTWPIKSISGRGYKGSCDGFSVFGLSSESQPDMSPIEPLDQQTDLSFEDQSRMLTSPVMSHHFRFQSVYQNRPFLDEENVPNGNTKSSKNAKSSSSSAASSSSSSAQPDGPGREPITSQFKQFSGTLDYILTTPGVQQLSYLPLPSDAQMEQIGFLPTLDFASDHLILMAQLQISNSD